MLQVSQMTDLFCRYTYYYQSYVTDISIPRGVENVNKKWHNKPSELLAENTKLFTP